MGWGSLLFHIRWRRKLKLPNLFDELKYESVTDAQKMVLSYPYLTTISGFISHSASSKCEMDMLDWHVSYMFCCDIGLVCPFIFCWLLWWLVKAFETSQNVFFEYDYEFTVLTRPLHRANCDMVEWEVCIIDACANARCYHVNMGWNLGGFFSGLYWKYVKWRIKAPLKSKGIQTFLASCTKYSTSESISMVNILMKWHNHLDLNWILAKNQE